MNACDNSSIAEYPDRISAVVDRFVEFNSTWTTNITEYVEELLT